MSAELPRVVRGTSIFEHIRSNLGTDGRIGDQGCELPDEEPTTPGGIRFGPGAFDGTVGHHFGTGEPQELAAKLADELRTAAARPSKRNLRRLYDSLASNDAALGLVDPALEHLAKLSPDRNRLHDIGRWLATTATHRDAVKIGMAILGVTGLDDRDAAILRTLGAHEEFTLYAAVAFTNGSASPERELWELAKATDAWGRIQCVERLRHTDDPEIRRWILREGFRNAVMYEYLAYIAADTGGLVDALEADEVDRELLTAAGEILEALLVGGPAKGIGDYAASADAVEAYLRCMQARADQLIDFQTVSSIAKFLARDDGWDDRLQHGWTATRRDAFEAACADVLGRPEWDDRIRTALLSDDPDEFWRADAAANVRGIDTFDIHLAHLEAEPMGSGWYRAWQQADHARAEQLVEVARTRLPLEEIATGPADAVGLGPEWRAHAALEWTLQALRDHVGVGPDLIVVGLSSPVVRNRNMSLNALKAWPREAWPPDALPLAQALAASDPKERTRDLAREVLDATGPVVP